MQRAELAELHDICIYIWAKNTKIWDVEVGTFLKTDSIHMEWNIFFLDTGMVIEENIRKNLVFKNSSTFLPYYGKLFINQISVDFENRIHVRDNKGLFVWIEKWTAWSQIVMLINL